MLLHGEGGDATLVALRAELAAVETKFGLTVTSVFLKSNPSATEAEQLRAVIDSLERVGEELVAGTLEVIELDD